MSETPEVGTGHKLTFREVLRAVQDPSDPMHEQAVEQERELADRLGPMVSDTIAKSLLSSRPVMQPLSLPEAPEAITARRLRDTNELLARMVDIAQADADRARADAAEANRRTRHALIAAWVAVGVTVAVGVVQVVVALTTGG